jgi:peptide/nickel transport system ATP-binding protein/oligopeptide transport system ATP-binding protein
MSLVEIRSLRVDFRRGPLVTRAVDDVSLAIEPGTTLGLVGESGSGKSVTGLSIGRLVASPPAVYASGEIFLEGRDVLKLAEPELRRIRGGHVGYVFQDPGPSLNPVMRVRAQIMEVLRLHRPEAATDSEIIRLLKLVGISSPEERARSYPHELSGGMQQRVVIAMALAAQPKLLVADEPTSALDVTIQSQVVALLRDLQRQFGMAILFITHNLGLLHDIADRVAVMYAGQIVEVGPVGEVLARPFHPYTRALLESVPTLSRSSKRLSPMVGAVPLPTALPGGCRFHPRCPQARPECSQRQPELVELAPGRWVRCPYWEQTPAG